MEVMKVMKVREVRRRSDGSDGVTKVTGSDEERMATGVLRHFVTLVTLSLSITFRRRLRHHHRHPPIRRHLRPMNCREGWPRKQCAN
jgi:hypothetical protein